MFNPFSFQPADRSGFPSQPEAELALAKEIERLHKKGIIQLKKGQVIKINGIPLRLEADVEAYTHPDNFKLVEGK